MRLASCTVLLLVAIAGQPRPGVAQPAAGPRHFSGLLAGARLRIVDVHGQRLEGRVASISDTMVWLRGDQPAVRPGIPVGEIRTIEVHAHPSSRGRTTFLGAGAGALLGALAGAAAHDESNTGSPGYGGSPSRSENILVGAVMGTVAGWAVGRYALGRARWRPVALP